MKKKKKKKVFCQAFMFNFYGVLGYFGGVKDFYVTFALDKPFCKIGK